MNAKLLQSLGNMQVLIVFGLLLMKTCQGCNNQPTEKKAENLELRPGQVLDLTGVNKHWKIAYDSNVCQALFDCDGFFIPSTRGCRDNFLEIIDGEFVKLRYCGYSSNLEYEAKGSAELDIKTVLKGV